jgi:xanthine dehydrogenase YagS FAD-binding subunit
VEEVITGRPLDANVAAKAAEAAIEGAAPMEQNGYKVPLLQSIVEEELLAIAGA